jgi:CRISPR-associated exonuclease Cas4
METNYIQIAALNHYSYCPHRYWRMFCANEFEDNQYTIDGTTLHERVHTMGDLNSGETWQIRAIYLKSEQYQLIGKADLIESENGQFFPVEYKRGKKGEWTNDELQVTAQALCLEEMTNTTINLGYVYYAQTHQRQEVHINQQLRQIANATIKAIQDINNTGKIPPPSYSKKCKGCSLYSACLPTANEKVNRYREED